MTTTKATDVTTVDPFDGVTTADIVRSADLAMGGATPLVYEAWKRIAAERLTITAIGKITGKGKGGNASVLFHGARLHAAFPTASVKDVRGLVRNGVAGVDAAIKAGEMPTGKRAPQVKGTETEKGSKGEASEQVETVATPAEAIVNGVRIVVAGVRSLSSVEPSTLTSDDLAALRKVAASGAAAARILAAHAALTPVQTAPVERKPRAKKSA